MANVLWWKSAIGEVEIAAVNQALDDRRLSMGAMAAELERQFAERMGAKYAVAAPSGSAALLFCMLALDVGPGDEVIVPNITWIATAHAASLLGARIVLVDTRPDLPLLDVGLVEKALTPRTKAVLPVHLNGRAVDMKALRALADRHGFAIVEDACQAILSQHDGRYLGTYGDLGCYSFGITKLITSGQGGMVVTDRDDLYRKMQIIRFHGVTTDADGRETYRSRGFNFKYSDLLASMALEQLKKIDTHAEHVRAIYRRYAEAMVEFNFLRTLPVREAAGELPLWFEVECEDREEFMAWMASRGFECRRTHPHLDRAAHLGQTGHFPNSIRQSREGLILPCGPAQPMENVEATIAAIRDYARQGG